MESQSPRVQATDSEHMTCTDSMVTVPLSDLQSNPDELMEESVDEVLAGSRASEHTPEEPESHPTPVEDATDDIVDGAGEKENIAESRVESVASQNNEDETKSIHSTSASDSVDWDELDKTEEQEPRSEATDESTSLLLARLEQENNALATNPKSGLAESSSRARSQSRPPSIQHLKKLVNDPSRSSLRYSQLPTPHMTELEFWAALVADYPQTAQRLPTLTSNKIRGGVPPPLRGVVWPSIAGARDPVLHDEFQRLCGETSPYEGLIGKDIGRSFPNVDKFRDPNGEGQLMLAKVLKCFSLYDTKIGYCQGLGFVVGPLLMHMTDADAFCVLVRLMDHYDLRCCFLPDLSGLHLRVYQFQNLLSRHMPTLFAHLEALNVEPVYVSQWFLSFFAVTCPLPMLLRIYDVLLLEGACETLMRVALSLMQRNEAKIMSCTEFEDVLQLLLSRSLWDTYACQADDLVRDFVSLTSLVTRENLQALETSYKASQGSPGGISFPQMQATASRFLGRLWAGSSSQISTKSSALTPGNSSVNSRCDSVIRRTPSKQSMASTLNSFESSSDASTAPTEVSSGSSSAVDVKLQRKSTAPQNKDRDLHGQIEDLLMALGDLQREQASLARDLQREREEREEDQVLARSIISCLKEHVEQPAPESAADIIAKAEERFSTTPESRRVSVVQTKQQLREDVASWKEKHELEATRCQELGRRIDAHETENAQLKEQLREARSRLQDGHRDKQRMEKTIQDMRARKPSQGDSPIDGQNSYMNDFADKRTSSGLREFKLGKPDSPSNTTFSKRSSSLNIQTVLSTTDNQPASEDSLLLELVNAKTAEAVAQQELEEVKAKLDSLRKLVTNGATTPSLSQRSSPLGDPSSATSLAVPPTINTPKSSPEQPPKLYTPLGGGGFFSGWTKRSAPSSNETTPDPK
ncbi:ecotropic viral integration site [Arachnomyces sp. PD_36]|nr:ecotropic viral integration site [Arachnomyces sp. PD_36]